MPFLHDVRFALRGFRRSPGITVVTVSVLGSLVPALRATRVDPLVALRAE